MPRINYIDGPTIEAEEGETVLDASVRHGVDHQQACGGDCRCSTCRIEVVEGAEHCPKPREDELEVLAVNALRPPIRLACQLRPEGDITVRVLLRESEQPGRHRSRKDWRKSERWWCSSPIFETSRHFPNSNSPLTSCTC